MKPVPLQDASTLVLLRDGPDGLEVLMGRRSRQTRFSAGAFVFPGGGVDAGDMAAIEHCHGISATTVDGLFEEEQALRYYLATARELFEEAGIWLFDGPRPPDWQHCRNALHQNHLLLDTLLTEHGSGLDCTRLHYYRFWTTPPGMPRRYRTRFFLAQWPADQPVQVDGSELTEHCWTRPQQMLQRHADGEVDLIFPTIKELEVLADMSTARQAMRELPARAPVREIRTRPLFENGRFVRVLMPDEPGYDELPGW